MTGSIRTFIAIDIPADAKDALAALTQALESRGLTGIRWVNPKGIHLTLKFLGNIPRPCPLVSSTPWKTPAEIMLPSTSPSANSEFSLIPTTPASSGLA